MVLYGSFNELPHSNMYLMTQIRYLRSASKFKPCEYDEDEEESKDDE